MDPGVNGSRFVLGVGIDGRTARNHGIHVRDPHQHTDSAIDAFGPLDLVEIARVVVVDRRPGQGSEVGDARLGPRLERSHLRNGGLGKIGLEAALDHLPAGGGQQVEAQRADLWAMK